MPKSYVPSISPVIHEAERISYKDAIFILLSVSFGIGYLDIFNKNDMTFNYYPLILQSFNLIIGITTCFMLSKVKREY